MSRALALLSCAVLLAAAAPRAPDQRQTLIGLAYVLGEAHGLRTACQGPEDQAWRSRMSRLIEVESPPEAFRRRLIDSFNAGFATRKAENPTCRPETAGEERAAAARGRDLARRLVGG